MFARKDYSKLLEWKAVSNGSTALLIEGARRVGKSTLAEEFAKNEYASYIVVDFTLVTDEFKQVFLDTRTDLDSFFLYLQATYGKVLQERNSLVIFDEVQLFPKAREFVKHLVADGRYDYIETGSLISIKKNVSDILIPSEEESIKMNPMDFEEFLWAMGQRPLADMIHQAFDSRAPLPEEMHRKSSRLWREYMLVGGMPQSVAAYVDGRDMMAADRAKRLVLKLYREDIEKYGGASAKRITAVFDSIPGQLSRHEKQLVYTQVEEGSRARDFSLAFAWLKEAATVNLCVRCTDPALGLALAEDDSSVKCYMADTGLLSTMALSASTEAMPDVYREVLLGDVGVNEGMLAENAVAQQLVASGHALFFYSKSSVDKDERMKIDFMVVRPYANSAGKPRISPLEVKSGRKVSTVSLDKFKRKFGKQVGEEFVLSPKQYKKEGDRTYLPLYMAFCL